MLAGAIIWIYINSCTTIAWFYNSVVGLKYLIFPNVFWHIHDADATWIVAWNSLNIKVAPVIFRNWNAVNCSLICLNHVACWFLFYFAFFTGFSVFFFSVEIAYFRVFSVIHEIRMSIYSAVKEQFGNFRWCWNSMVNFLAMILSPNGLENGWLWYTIYGEFSKFSFEHWVH